MGFNSWFKGLIRHLVYVTLCRWPSGVQVWMELQFQTCTLDDHLHRVTHTRCINYNLFSWWWAQGYSKHVENWNKYVWQKIGRQVGYLQELNRDAQLTKHKIHSDNSSFAQENSCHISRRLLSGIENAWY